MELFEYAARESERRRERDVIALEHRLNELRFWRRGMLASMEALTPEGWAAAIISAGYRAGLVGDADTATVSAAQQHLSDIARRHIATANKRRARRKQP